MLDEVENLDKTKQNKFGPVASLENTVGTTDCIAENLGSTAMKTSITIRSQKIRGKSKICNGEYNKENAYTFA